MAASNDNLAETRGKHTRAGRAQYLAKMAGNDVVDDFDRAALTTNGVRHYARRGRRAFLDGRAINDPPLNSVPGAQAMVQNTTLTFNAGNSNLISISDPDVGTADVEVALTATNGTFSLSGITGLAFTTGDGAADAAMTFTGTIVAVNTALDGLVFTSTPEFNGAASLQIVTDDLGGTGSGGAKTDTDTIAITVTVT